MGLKMNLKREINIRTIVVYLIAFAAASYLIEVVWGTTAGVVGGLSLVSNKESLLEITSFLEERGIDQEANNTNPELSYEKLSEKDKKKLKEKLNELSQEVVSGVNWFYVTLFVSAVVFSIVGFLSGFFSRGWLLAGIVPISSFLTNNPVIRFNLAKDLPIRQKVLVNHSSIRYVLFTGLFWCCSGY